MSAFKGKSNIPSGHKEGHAEILAALRRFNATDEGQVALQWGYSHLAETSRRRCYETASGLGAFSVQIRCVNFGHSHTFDLIF